MTDSRSDAPWESPDETTSNLLHQGDVMTASMVLVLTGMEERLAEDGWDQPPRLFAVHRLLAPPEVAQADDGVTDALALAVTQVDIDLTHMDGTDMARTMTELAHAIDNHPAGREVVTRLLARHADGTPHADTLGWVLAHEGWMVQQPPELGTREAEQALRDAHDRTIHLRPDRIEVRLVAAVDNTGTRYQLIRQRNDEPKVMVTGSTGPTHIDGDIPQALAALAEVTA